MSYDNLNVPLFSSHVCSYGSQGVYFELCLTTALFCSDGRRLCTTGLENMQDPIPIEITGLCRCLAILGQDETYILYVLCSPPPFIKRFHATAKTKLIYNLFTITSLNWKCNIKTSCDYKLIEFVPVHFSIYERFSLKLYFFRYARKNQ